MLKNYRGRKWDPAIFLFAVCIFGTPTARAKTKGLAPGTAVPVIFTRTINVKTSRTGDRITAKITQVIFNGPVQTVAKGSLVAGHIEKVSYSGKDDPSSLEIKFDELVTKHEKQPVCFSVRALADLNHVYNAHSPVTSMDAGASLGTTLVGGDHIQLGGKQVYAKDGDNVGISNRFGIFSRLEPADPHDNSTPVACGGVSTLQSVAIFSSRACGLYGFSGMQLIQTGGPESNGTIELQSKRGAVEIHSGSAALLQVVGCGETQSSHF